MAIWRIDSTRHTKHVDTSSTQRNVFVIKKRVYFILMNRHQTFYCIANAGIIKYA